MAYSIPKTDLKLHILQTLTDDVSHDLRTVEVKQENRELDSSEMYRCQKNDLAAK